MLSELLKNRHLKGYYGTQQILDSSHLCYDLELDLWTTDTRGEHDNGTAMLDSWRCAHNVRRLVKSSSLLHQNTCMGGQAVNHMAFWFEAKPTHLRPKSRFDGWSAGFAACAAARAAAAVALASLREAALSVTPRVQQIRCTFHTWISRRRNIFSSVLDHHELATFVYGHGAKLLSGNSQETSNKTS